MRDCDPVRRLALRGTLHWTGLPLIALIFVLGFVTIRVASFHDMDALISNLVGPLRVNWLLEIPGPLLIVLCALHRIWGGIYLPEPKS